jgi:hypothetical protein
MLARGGLFEQEPKPVQAALKRRTFQAPLIEHPEHIRERKGRISSILSSGSSVPPSFQR